MSDTNKSKKRLLTDFTAIDVITKISLFLSTLTSQDTYQKAPKPRLDLSDAQQKIQDYVTYGQDVKNCSLNQRGQPVFRKIWHCSDWHNFAYGAFKNFGPATKFDRFWRFSE